jgi:hypothetical protein
MAETVDWPPRRPQRRRGRLAAALLLGATLQRRHDAVHAVEAGFVLGTRRLLTTLNLQSWSSRRRAVTAALYGTFRRSSRQHRPPLAATRHQRPAADPAGRAGPAPIALGAAIHGVVTALDDVRMADARALLPDVAPPFDGGRSDLRPGSRFTSSSAGARFPSG